VCFYIPDESDAKLTLPGELLSLRQRDPETKKEDRKKIEEAQKLLAEKAEQAGVEVIEAEQESVEGGKVEQNGVKDVTAEQADIDVKAQQTEVDALTEAIPRKRMKL
jgi:nucleotide-binding universal stress UspA family protein